MRRLLFYTAWCFDDEASNGITKKIRAEMDALTRAGFAVDYTCIEQGFVTLCCDGETRRLGRSVPYLTRIVAARCVRREIERRDLSYDFAYVRYPQSDPALLGLLDALKKRGTRTVVEIPTYPYDREFQSSLPLRASLLLDRCCRKRLKRSVERFVAFFPYEEIFGVPVICTRNGLDFSKVPVSHKAGADECVHLIAVAGLMPWHGFDRIIRAMGRDQGAPVVLDVVGDGAELPRLKSAAQALGLYQRVRFHGFQSGDALSRLFDQADAGVSSLGLHRKACPGDSTLKTPEYFARGLPVVASEGFTPYPDMTQYMLFLPADESLPDMERICAFVRGVYMDRDYQAVREEIRRRAEVYCSMDATMRPVVDHFLGEGRR